MNPRRRRLSRHRRALRHYGPDAALALRDYAPTPTIGYAADVERRFARESAKRMAKYTAADLAAIAEGRRLYGLPA